MLDVDYYVDDRAGARFRGWVWLPAARELVLSVELAAPDGTVVAEVAADEFRSDLADAGKRDGACGFVIRVPPVCPSGLYTLRARRGDLAVALAAPEWFEAPWVAAAWPSRLSVPTIDDTAHEPTDLTPNVPTALDTMLAAARPEILVCRDLAPARITSVRARLAPLGLEDLTIVEFTGPLAQAVLDDAVGAAERVCVLFQPRDGEAMLADAVASLARLVSAGGFIVVFCPSSRDRSVAIYHFLAADRRFVVDCGEDAATTAPLVILRRRHDPRRRRDDRALDDLEGI